MELLGEAPLFADRADAGRTLAPLLTGVGDSVVVGLARGGVVVAAEVATALELPLDVLAVRKVGHPWQPEYAIGAVTPGGGVYVRGHDGLTDEQVETAVEAAAAEARELDARLHRSAPPIALADRGCVLVDDGLATGATMLAAVRWARRRAATRVVAAVPVAAAPSVQTLAAEADAVVCPHVLDAFHAVGLWYASFDQVGDADVERLLAAARRAEDATAR